MVAESGVGVRVAVTALDVFVGFGVDVAALGVLVILAVDEDVGVAVGPPCQST